MRVDGGREGGGEKKALGIIAPLLLFFVPREGGINERSESLHPPPPPSLFAERKGPFPLLDSVGGSSHNHRGFFGKRKEEALSVK